MIHIPVNKPPREELLSKPEVKRCLYGWGRTGDRGFIAVDDDQISVGAGWYRLFPANEPGYGFIDEQTPEIEIAVSSSSKGQGIGSQLLRRLIEQAGLDGYQAISLSVDPTNAALHLYERFGFTKVGTSGTSWTMKLDLPK
ncbi:GNAT family N-acetyltransferase [Paenibacillus sp. WST5]|uniref:GNAT family N-acetyltransferase n=2 Tax=Paenibacillus sedimenti TaxID=2770274 RepID=A0A926QI29_9BACL|nr:GNAT family N-acetyltransferase [Paenibacillus sedimenti]